MDNLRIWKEVEKTDRKFTKEVSYGKRKFTSIQAQYQRKRATFQFGPYGSTWGVRNCKFEYIREPFIEKGTVIEKIVEIVLTAEFYYPDNGEEKSFELSVDAQYSPGSDSRKKILTDLTTKALSFLGFSADIFMDGKSDDAFADNKYVNPAERRSARDNRPKAQLTEKQLDDLLVRLAASDKKGKIKLLENANAYFSFSEKQRDILAEIEENLKHE